MIAASSDAAIARAMPAIRASGRRIGGTSLIDKAQERIERQVSASALWLEIDDDPGGPLDDLLALVRSDVAAGRYSAVVSTTRALLDPVLAPILDSEIELLVDADDAARAAALAIASARSAEPLRVADISGDASSVRLRQLSDEVNRIATTLARLSSAPAVAPILPSPGPNGGDVAPIAAETVRSVIRARRLRNRFFSEDLFADPAWDMLLDLLQAEISQLRVPVSSLCMAASVPATTALRWLKAMVDQGMFLRRSDPHDGRRVFFELAPETSDKLRRYLAEVERTVVI